MLDAFQKNIHEKGWLNPDNKILLAVSGGIDSVVMAWLFSKSDMRCGIAHCNFGLRGVESDGDEWFVTELAGKLRMDIHTQLFETEKYAESKGISIQMAARDLRYEWFEKLMQKYGYTYIATAHHADDHAETVLINLAKGTGLAGMQGIPEKRDHIIRPLLNFSRQEIDDFARENNLAYRNDSSNNETKYTRNKIRHEVIPVFQKINPSFAGAVRDFSSIARKAEMLIGFYTERYFEGLNFFKGDQYYIDKDALMKLPEPGFILFELLKGYGFQYAVVSDILAGIDGQPGRQYHSSTHTCLADRKYLVVYPSERQKEEPAEYTVNEIDESIVLDSGKLTFTFFGENFSMGLITGDPKEAFFDQDKLSFPLRIRRPQPGDCFFPFGMSGKMKVSDYLTNEKKNRYDKGRVWLLCNADDIIWVTGMRADNRYRVNDHTRNVLKVKFESFNE